MEQAVQFFRLQLNTGAAADARDYLTRRGLDEQGLERWEIGFAPDAWQGLWDHLTGKGVADDLILAAGLAKPSTKGGKPYDTFRNRIMFPIRDARGRAIAFGGRAMDPNDNAKYLNSPETELFDKGHNLYNHAPAREAAGKGQPLIVAEGYMDVIALDSGGFNASVAPLGTAVTEAQLQLLWRIADEPLIALDGDTAGLRAAMRLIDLALPLLEAGKSLRFAIMPEGQDPDDLIRASGPASVQKLLDQALPMVRLLWQRETDGKVFDSPERKAALDKALREKIKLIRDPSIRSHYGQEIKNLRWELFNPRKRPGQGQWTPGRKAKAAAQITTRKSALATGAEEDLLLQDVLCATLLIAPALREEFISELELLHFAESDTNSVFQVLLRSDETDSAKLRDTVANSVGASALENLLNKPHVRNSPPVFQDGDIEAARLQLRLGIDFFTSKACQDAEVSEAEEEMRGVVDEAVTWRLRRAAEERDKAVKFEHIDAGEQVIADNGIALDRLEIEKRNADFAKIDFSKGGRSGK